MKALFLQLVLILLVGLFSACVPTEATLLPAPSAQVPQPTWTAGPPAPTPTARPTRQTRTPLPPGAPTRAPRPTQSPIPTPTPFSGESQDPPQTYALDDVTMTLARTVCFGTCPEYTVTVSGDGTVRYAGGRFVRVEGAQERQISREAVETLLREFYTIDFFHMRPEYMEGRDILVDEDGTVHETGLMVTDLPTTIVTLTIGGYGKNVRAYYGAPESVYTLATHIDEAAGTAEWVRP